MIGRIPDATLPKELSRGDTMLEVFYQRLAVKDEVAKSIAESTFLEGVCVALASEFQDSQ
jgi:hypothetical protein